MAPASHLAVRQAVYSCAVLSLSLPAQAQVEAPQVVACVSPWPCPCCACPPWTAGGAAGSMQLGLHHRPGGVRATGKWPFPSCGQWVAAGSSSGLVPRPQGRARCGVAAWVTTACLWCACACVTSASFSAALHLALPQARTLQQSATQAPGAGASLPHCNLAIGRWCGPYYSQVRQPGQGSPSPWAWGVGGCVRAP